MKKILAIILTIICVKLLLSVKKQEETTAEEEKEAKTKAAEEKAAQKAEVLKQLEIKQTVDTFYYSQNGCLPVYASDWSPIAKISKEDWKYAKQEFSALGTTYKKMYDKINKVSSGAFKTGFHKSEFDSIFWDLRHRSQW